MATNASTWFYAEPEHRPYLIEERVNHTFWANRITEIYFKCTRAEPPFRMEGEWRGILIVLEWIPGDHLILTTQAENDVNAFLVGVKEILGFPPTISYVDAAGKLKVEWYVQRVDQRIQEIQGNPNYRQIKRYTK